MEIGYICYRELYELFTKNTVYVDIGSCNCLTIMITDINIITESEERYDDDRSILYITKGELMKLVSTGIVKLYHYLDMLQIEVIEDSL